MNSLDPRDRKAAVAPKALFLATGARDKGIDIQTVRTFVKELRPSYESFPDRLAFLEEPEAGHTVTDRMWGEGTRWLLRHLVEQPIRSSR